MRHDRPARLSRHRHTLCTVCGKRGYFDRKTARLVRRQLGQQSDAAVHVYKCLDGMFHVGHTKPGAPRSMFDATRNTQLEQRLLGEAAGADRSVLVLLTAFTSVAWLENEARMMDMDPAAYVIKPSRFVPHAHVYVVANGHVERIAPAHEEG